MLWNSTVAKQTLEAEVNFVSESKYWAKLYFRYMTFYSVSPSAPRSPGGVEGGARVREVPHRASFAVFWLCNLVFFSISLGRCINPCLSLYFFISILVNL